MNAAFLPEIQSNHRRAIEVEFLVERYHRAFDEEGAALAALARASGVTRLVLALEKVRPLLDLHQHLQEKRLFPEYELGREIGAALFEDWKADNAAIGRAIGELRDVSGSLERHRLGARAIHFAEEIERHLVDEVEVLAEWAGSAAAE